MRKLSSISFFVLLYVTMAFGQAAIDIPLTLSDDGTTPGGNTINFGLDLTATTGIDPALGESDLPPFPPVGVYEARFDLNPFPPVGNGLSTYKDFRNAPAFPFTGTVEHRLKWQLSTGAGALTVSYNLPPEATMQITDLFPGTPVYNSGVLTGTGSVNIAGIADAKVFIVYTNIGPASPGPVFSMTPGSLSFGTVGVGNSSTLPVTVSNPGTTNQLDITGAVSSNPEFTFLPNTFPINVAPGGSQVFNVTFTPADNGAETGTIDFTHNAPGSPTTLNVSGTGQTQGGLLRFKSPVRDVLDGSTNNPDTVVLSGYSGQPLKALQFNVLVGKTNGGLILSSVTRGAAIPAGQFNFSYEIYPGSFLPDGSSVDTLKVVILGNGTNVIPPLAGDQEIMTFSFNVVPISVVSTQTFMGLAGVTGATSAPVVDANIGAGPDEIINIFNGTLEGLLGDVNLDNQVNILDILLMIDYILGRVEFNAQQFFQGDISPWAAGDPLPTRDAVINVLDLAVLQNIVLTGVYPSGDPVLKMAANPFALNITSMEKLTPGMNAKVTFYLTTEGITVGLESIKKVKGLQMELNELSSIIPQNTQMSSIFDQAVYYQNNAFLRMLSYDGQSNPINEGEFLGIIASVPFTLINRENIVVERVIVADENNNEMDKVEIEIRYDNPSLPLDYQLFQNFPNPFNPATSVQFSVPQEGLVTIKVYDMLGQEVTSLFTGNAKAGKYTLNWNGLDHNGNQVSSGSYVYKMTAGEFVQSKKMMFIK